MSILRTHKKKKSFKANDISQITESKNKLVKKLLSYTISDELKKLCFNPKKLDKEGYVKYMDGLFIKNLTTEELESEEISVFKIKTTKNIEAELHSHKTQSQTLYVVKGSIVCLNSDITFKKGQSFFVQKNTFHSLKYIKGTIATVVYLPNLKKI